jgi:hypothetical protein
MSEISELEKLVRDEQPEPTPDRSPLHHSKIAYSLGVIVIDLITGYTIWMLTYWYYGLIWVFAGAAAFFLHQRNFEHPDKNEKQEKNTLWGMGVSVGSMFLMAVLAGGVYVAGIKTPLIEIVVVAATITLFFWHCFQLAMFVFADDEWQINMAIARANSNANKKVRIIEAGGRVVAANAKAQQTRKEQYRKHGDAGAVDAAIAKINKQPQRQFANESQNSPKLQQNAPQQAQQAERGKDTAPKV